jgi:hypothetical protein
VPPPRSLPRRGARAHRGSATGLISTTVLEDGLGRRLIGGEELVARLLDASNPAGSLPWASGWQHGDRGAGRGGCPAPGRRGPPAGTGRPGSDPAARASEATSVEAHPSLPRAQITGPTGPMPRSSVRPAAAGSTSSAGTRYREHIGRTAPDPIGAAAESDPGVSGGGGQEQDGAKQTRRWGLESGV